MYSIVCSIQGRTEVASLQRVQWVARTYCASDVNEYRQKSSRRMGLLVSRRGCHAKST